MWWSTFSKRNKTFNSGFSIYNGDYKFRNDKNLVLMVLCYLNWCSEDCGLGLTSMFSGFCFLCIFTLYFLCSNYYESMCICVWKAQVHKLRILVASLKINCLEHVRLHHVMKEFMFLSCRCTLVAGYYVFNSNIMLR